MGLDRVDQVDFVGHLFAPRRRGQEGLGDGDPPHDLSQRGDVPPGRLAHDHLRYCRAPRRGAVVANMVGSTASLMQAAGSGLAAV